MQSGFLIDVEMNLRVSSTYICSFVGERASVAEAFGSRFDPFCGMFVTLSGYT